ncbi:pilin [Nonomuraea sp. B12E4]|uniref:pilin n=1 Tax=Nonomuraea sp. B12E4 TaxID=3153564 RepID=UPI00325D1BE3
MSAHRLDESPLDTAETSFRLLTTGPGSLSLDCTALAPGLPRGPIVLLQLRELLTSHGVTDDARDAVWRELVVRARRSGPSWTVAAVGMAMPALRRVALSLTRDLPCGDPVDIDIAVLAGFLRGLHRVDTQLADIRPRLCEAARWSGESTRRYIIGRAPAGEPPPAAPRPWHHPELVLIDAIADGVLSEHEAELISLTQLERTPLRPTHKPSTDQVLPRWRQAGATSLHPPTASSDLEEAPTDPARSQATPDADTATDSKGGGDTIPGSARISPNHPSVVGRARRRHAARQRRVRKRYVRALAASLVAAAAIAVLLVAVVATKALAAYPVAAAPADLNTVFNNLRNWLIGMLATLATLMLTIGGLRYLIAGGDPGEVQKAKGALKAAAFGYALAVLAPLFLSVLKRIVGG